MKHLPKPRLSCAAIALLGSLLALSEFRPVIAEPAVNEAAAKPLTEPVRAFLAKHCQECHRGDKAKGQFRLDRLTADFADKASRERWLSVLEQIKAGAMPPKGKPRPADYEVKDLTDWIGASVTAGDAAQRRLQGRVVCRRLNRIEYENTVRDLLGVDVELKELLPHGQRRRTASTTSATRCTSPRS